MTTANPRDTGVQYALWLNNVAGVDVTDLVEYAIAAEDAGWDGVFLSDSITWEFSDPWTILIQAGNPAR